MKRVMIVQGIGFRGVSGNGAHTVCIGDWGESAVESSACARAREFMNNPGYLVARARAVPASPVRHNGPQRRLPGVVLRILDESGTVPPQLLPERAFLAEVEAIVQRGARCPRWMIESVDGLGKAHWRAYCSSVTALLKLAEQLRADEAFGRAADSADDARP